MQQQKGLNGNYSKSAALSQQPLPKGIRRRSSSSSNPLLAVAGGSFDADDGGAPAIPPKASPPPLPPRPPARNVAKKDVVSKGGPVAENVTLSVNEAAVALTSAAGGLPPTSPIKRGQDDTFTIGKTDPYFLSPSRGAHGGASTPKKRAGSNTSLLHTSMGIPLPAAPRWSETTLKMFRFGANNLNDTGSKEEQRKREQDASLKLLRKLQQQQQKLRGQQQQQQQHQQPPSPQQQPPPPQQQQEQEHRNLHLKHFKFGVNFVVGDCKDAPDPKTRLTSRPTLVSRPSPRGQPHTTANGAAAAGTAGTASTAAASATSSSPEVGGGGNSNSSYARRAAVSTTQRRPSFNKQQQQMGEIHANSPWAVNQNQEPKQSALLKLQEEQQKLRKQQQDALSFDEKGKVETQRLRVQREKMAQRVHRFGASSIQGAGTVKAVLRAHHRPQRTTVLPDGTTIALPPVQAAFPRRLRARSLSSNSNRRWESNLPMGSETKSTSTSTATSGKAINEGLSTAPVGRLSRSNSTSRLSPAPSSYGTQRPF